MTKSVEYFYDYVSAASYFSHFVLPKITKKAGATLVHRPMFLGGVMHYHGDALPIVSPSALLDVAVEEGAVPEHVVVVAADGGDTPRLGLPVGRVLGLVNAPPPATRQPEPVTARLPVEGRVVGILDAQHLCDRAAELVARSAEPGFNDSEQWGETT